MTVWIIVMTNLFTVLFSVQYTYQTLKSKVTLFFKGFQGVHQILFLLGLDISGDNYFNDNRDNVFVCE